MVPVEVLLALDGDGKGRQCAGAVAIGRAIEALPLKIFDFSLVADVVLVLEDAEVLAVHDYQLALGRRHDIVAAAVAVVSSVGFADCLTIHEASF